MFILIEIIIWTINGYNKNNYNHFSLRKKIKYECNLFINFSILSRNFIISPLPGIGAFQQTKYFIK